MKYDTIIVGGGPAGLSAALVLGRCRRRVVVIDASKPRNAASHHIHNYLSRDGIAPAKFLGLGRGELERYGVEFRPGFVRRAECAEDGFRVFVGRSRLESRTLLLATGVADELPEVRSLRTFYGSGVHHCPYCDAWEYRDKPIAAYGDGKRGLGLAMNLLTWTDRVTVVTDGRPMSATDRRRAERLGIAVRDEPVRRLAGRTPEGRRPKLERVVFESGPDLRISALFFNTDQYQRSPLPGLLGCSIGEDGGVQRDRRQRTGVPGLYLAGDASKDVQFVIVAASEGARAGVGINSDLQREDLRRKPGRSG